jgi:hypothetical protein
MERHQSDGLAIGWLLAVATIWTSAVVGAFLLGNLIWGWPHLSHRGLLLALVGSAFASFAMGIAVGSERRS